MSPRAPEERWRRTGSINVALVGLGGVVLLICLAKSLSQPGTSLTRATLLFQGPCKKSERLNLVIHLIINCVSSGILASSNYFMQVLSAPDRREVDRAHSHLCSLDIGIPSPKNIFHVSRFKLVAYFVLFFSSIPLHVFFNSAVFEIGYQGGKWDMTVATEAFINGTDFFLPGASLTSPGWPIPMNRYLPTQRLNQLAASLRGSPPPIPFNSSFGFESQPGQYHYELARKCNDWIYMAGSPVGYDTTEDRCVLTDSITGGFSYGYGVPAPMSQWKGQDSTTYQKLKKAASEIAQGQWTRLEAADCLREYKFCKPRQQYRDVVVIVDTPSSGGGGGWTRSDVFVQDTLSNYTSAWDSWVPPDQPNPLWFSTGCVASRDAGTNFGKCFSNCARLLGSGFVDMPADSNGAGDDTITNHEIVIPQWPDQSGYIPRDNLTLTYPDQLQLAFDKLNVDHCWTQEIQLECKLEVSNILILIVVACFFIKVIACAIVVWKLPRLSLVTPGDAIESFMVHPDPTTFGLSTLDLDDSLRLGYGPRRFHSAATDPDSGLLQGVVPRRFNPRTHRLWSSFPFVVWVRTYGLLFIGAGVTIGGTITAIIKSPDHSFDIDSFGPSSSNRPIGIINSFFGALLFANSPQLLLSFCYFIYNAFLTRLQVEKEWNSYADKSLPLRVTYPRGGQTSSYRLQLPYRWSLPLLGLSALLHLLVSNSVFIFIIEGGYWDVWNMVRDADLWLDLAPGSSVAVGYSPVALVILTAVSLFAMTVPFLLSMRKVKHNMVAGGSDSLVISAACHCIPAILPNKQKAESNGIYSPNWDPDEVILDDEEIEGRLRELSQSPVRWGAMDPSADLRRAVRPRDDGKLMHLGFGGESTGMTPPDMGEWYV